MATNLHCGHVCPLCKGRGEATVTEDCCMTSKCVCTRDVCITCVEAKKEKKKG